MMSQQMRDAIFNLAMVSVKRKETKEQFMKDMEKIYDEAKWVLDGIN